MQWRAPLCVMILAAVAAVPALATVGGEHLCEVLGYEAATGRVYVHQMDGSGGFSFGDVAWLATDGDDAGLIHGVDWDRGGENTADDPDLNRRLDDLRARLVPLRLVHWQTLPLSTAVVMADSVPNAMGRTKRLRVRAVFGLGPEVEVTCWETPVITRPVVYELPGGEGWLWVLAFIGDDFEVGYETQVPVLVRPGDAGVREVTWRRWTD